MINVVVVANDRGGGVVANNRYGGKSIKMRIHAQAVGVCLLLEFGFPNYEQTSSVGGAKQSELSKPIINIVN